MRSKYRCNLCGITLRSRTAWRSHTRFLHPRCTRCNKTFKDGAALRDHRHHLSCRTHTNQDYNDPTNNPQAAYVCSKCWHSYPDMDAVNTHCCQCDRIFQSKASLENHLVSHYNHVPPSARPKRGEQFLRYRCPLCTTAYRTKRQLLKHQRGHGRGLPCLAAHRCTQFFETADNMIEHFDNGECESKLSLSQAYVMARPDDIRARAERWVDHCFEQHEEQQQQPGFGSPLSQSGSSSSWVSTISVERETASQSTTPPRRAAPQQAGGYSSVEFDEDPSPQAEDQDELAENFNGYIDVRDLDLYLYF